MAVQHCLRGFGASEFVGLTFLWAWARHLGLPSCPYISHAVLVSFTSDSGNVLHQTTRWSPIVTDFATARRDSDGLTRGWLEYFTLMNCNLIESQAQSLVILSFVYCAWTTVWDPSSSSEQQESHPPTPLTLNTDHGMEASRQLAEPRLWKETLSLVRCGTSDRQLFHHPRLRWRAPKLGGSCWKTCSLPWSCLQITFLCSVFFHTGAGSPVCLPGFGRLHQSHPRNMYAF